ncbi:Ger(x)C family spore germination protein [Bacillus lacus]|uniref:Ger(X)C family spore germination protein n=1 Tax=Metabacillus lacus TaxID=1983721 RepID=A0A7X2IZD9_9BACI|nr:Ger(x)C family spore germination protein [Metabacillus lacus]
MKKLLAGLCMLMLLTGCLEKEILDDVNMILASGFDIDEENKELFVGTAYIPVYLKDQPVEPEYITSSSKISREVLSNMQRKSSNPLVFGKLQVTLFGKELAEKGLLDFVDALQRDASIGSRVYLGVVRGTAGKVLEGTYGTLGTAAYLSDTIKHNIERRDLPDTNLQLFLYNFYSEGSDPYLPLLKKTEGKVEVDGIALFHGDEMVDEISPDEQMFFKLMADNYSEGTYSTELPDSNNMMTVQSITSRRKLHVESEEKIKIDIRVEGHIREYTGIILNPGEIKKIEKEFERAIREEGQKIIEKFKENNIDPLGFNDEIGHRFRNHDKKKWKSDGGLEKLEVEIHADVLITETGVIE